MFRLILLIGSLLVISFLTGLKNHVALDYRSDFRHALELEDTGKMKDVASIWIANTPDEDFLNMACEVARGFIKLETEYHFADLLMIRSCKKLSDSPDDFNQHHYGPEEWACHKDEIMISLLQLRREINLELKNAEIVNQIDREILVLTGE